MKVRTVAAFLCLFLAQASFAKSKLSPGETLNPGESISSDNGRYRLVMQDDGNLVLYNLGDGSPLWSSQTQGNGQCRCVVQSDGNIVIYRADGQALWNTGTQGKNVTMFCLQDDSNICAYGAGGPVWHRYLASQSSSQSSSTGSQWLNVLANVFAKPQPQSSPPPAAPVNRPAPPPPPPVREYPPRPRRAVPDRSPEFELPAILSRQEWQHEMCIGINPAAPNPGDVYCRPDEWTTYYYTTDGDIENDTVVLECVDGLPDFRRLQYEVCATGSRQIRLRLRANDRNGGITRVSVKCTNYAP